MYESMNHFNKSEMLYSLIVRLNFTSNTAEKGGAILFVANNTNDGVNCQEANTEIYQTECFLQTLGLHQTVLSFSVYNINSSVPTLHINLGVIFKEDYWTDAL